MTAPRHVEGYTRGDGKAVGGYNRGTAKPSTATLADGTTGRSGGSFIHGTHMPGPVVGDPDGDGDLDTTAAGQADDANPVT